MKVKSVIISAFPMSGKSASSIVFNFMAYARFYEFKKDIVDISLSKNMWLDKKNRVYNPNFPKNYVDEVEHNIGKSLVIFVSTNEQVRNEMKNRGIKYTLAYPKLEAKDDLLNSIKVNIENGLGRTKEFYNWFEQNFESEIKKLEKDDCKNRFVFKKERSFIVHLPILVDGIIMKQVEKQLTNKKQALINIDEINLER